MLRISCTSIHELLVYIAYLNKNTNLIKPTLTKHHFLSQSYNVTTFVLSENRVACCDMGWGCIMLCDYLKHFSCSEIGLNSRNLPTVYTEFERAVFPLLGILQEVMPGDEYKLHVCINSV
jgi:hypothetical protein